jgi:hypothetical protein
VGSSPSPSAKWPDLGFCDFRLSTLFQTSNCPKNRCRRSWVVLSRRIEYACEWRMSRIAARNDQLGNILATRGCAQDAGLPLDGEMTNAATHLRKAAHPQAPSFSTKPMRSDANRSGSSQWGECPAPGYTTSREFLIAAASVS